MFRMEMRKFTGSCGGEDSEGTHALGHMEMSKG
jgi:hypothetical protein